MLIFKKTNVSRESSYCCSGVTLDQMFHVNHPRVGAPDDLEHMFHVNQSAVIV